MKTNKQKIKILMDNFYDKEKNSVDLSNLDFGDMSVNLSNIKAKIIYNAQQQATKIWNVFQKADGIDNSFQEAEYVNNDYWKNIKNEK